MGAFIKLILSIIINPVVLAGIGVSWYIIFHYGLDNYRQLLSVPYIYVFLWGFCLIYALVLKHVYVPNSNKVDWWATFKSSFGHLLVMLLTIVVACSVYYVSQDNWGEKLDRYARNQKVQDTLPINQQRTINQQRY
ncbi:MAG: hypothetical protein IJS88_00175 [Alphaproteobacteria bacterium]|nr:hypothetical protein [Alphaproteobacteria bacterium]